MNIDIQNNQESENLLFENINFEEDHPASKAEAKCKTNKLLYFNIYFLQKIKKKLKERSNSKKCMKRDV